MWGEMSLKSERLKSDRLKKLESELRDLEEWLRLGLVPKKDIVKHKEEIQQVQVKIEEERNRLRLLKESGELEEYTTKKASNRPAPFTDSPTMPDIDFGDDAYGDMVGGSNDADNVDFETSSIIEEKDTVDESIAEDTKDENPFSDKNRWMRGISDPENDDW